MWELCLRFFSFVFSFYKTKGNYSWKQDFCRLCVRNPAFGLLQIGQKSEKWPRRHSFPTWRHHQIFWRCFASHWSQFHVNIIIGSGIMTIFFYKGLTRNPEIGNTHVCVLPNIWRLGWVMDTRFGTNVSTRMSLNYEKCQSYSFYRFWVIKRKTTGGINLPSPASTQIRC